MCANATMHRPHTMLSLVFSPLPIKIIPHDDRVGQENDNRSCTNGTKHPPHMNVSGNVRHVTAFCVHFSNRLSAYAVF